MDPKVSRLLAHVQNPEVADALSAKLQGKETFIAMQIFEPNGRVSVPDALSFAAHAKLVGELGGKFIVLISDVVASMHRYFKRDQNQFDLVTKHFLTIVKALGCDGPHVEFIVANDSTPDDYQFFHHFCEFAIKLPIVDLQSKVPCAKGQCLQTSDVLAPLMNASEVIAKGADVVFATGVCFDQLSILPQLVENPAIVLKTAAIPKLRGPKAALAKPDVRDHFFFEDQQADLDSKANKGFCTDEISDNPPFDMVAWFIIPFTGIFEFSGKSFADDKQFAAEFPGLDKKNLKQEIAHIFGGIVDPIRPLVLVPEFQGLAKVLAAQ